MTIMNEPRPLLRDLLEAARRGGASDLHLVANHAPFVRVNGDIVPLPHAPVAAAVLEDALLATLSEEQLRVWEATRQLCYTYQIPGLGFFRFNLYSHLGRVEASIRIGRTDLASLAALGIPALMAELIRKPSGLILITGSTGSGKTTTMNAILHRVGAEHRRKIITIEDPIEFVHPPTKALLVQQEIGLDCPTFASAVRHALRQDPDIICIGELRDLETIEVALTAAETGHMVLATLHTTSAVGTIGRIIDVFPAEQQTQVRLTLASTLQAVMCQRLLPKADGSGRVLCYELMLVNDAIRNLIRENKAFQIPNQMQMGRAQGMREMDVMVKEAYQSGEISFETASTAVANPRLLLNR